MVSEMELILGHNQFIGISHISEDKSREKDKRFSKIENIYNIVEIASELGYKSMIIETHPRMLEFLNYYDNNRTFDMDFYLQVPYAAGYVKKINENGFFGLISDFVGQTGILSAGNIALKSASNMFRRNYMAMAMSALELEVSPFSKYEIKSLLLHNVFTDLLLSLGISDAFIEYDNYVKEELNLNPGFTTINFHNMIKYFKEWNINPKFVMTPININGYDMIPSKNEVEKSIKKYNGNLIAMNVLGGGAFSVKDANDYLKSLNIKKCVVGASSREHLAELVSIFKD